MSNPTSIDALPAVLGCSTTELVIGLNPDREYTVAHDGEDVSGSAATTTVYLAMDAAADNDASEGANKAKLLNGRALIVGPGVTSLRLRTASGSPTVTVVPSGALRGNY